MMGQIARRSVRAVSALLVVTAVVFALLHLSGDPTYILLAPEATAEERAVFRATYGLDRPLPVQYLSYLGRVARGDFGQSFSFQTPALAVVLQRLADVLPAFKQVVQDEVQLPQGRTELAAVVGHKSRNLL